MAPLILRILIGIIAIGALVAVAMLFVLLPHLGLWVRSRRAGVPVGVVSIMMMKLRNTPPETIINNRIRGMQQAGLELSAWELERHHLAGGNVGRVVEALIVIHRGGTMAVDRSTFEGVCAADLAGADPRRAAEAVALAESRGIAVTWHDAITLGRAGEDPVAAVEAEAGRSDPAGP